MLPTSRLGAFGLLASLVAVPASGAEIRVISTHNIRPALDDLQKDFEHSGTDKIVFISQGAAATQKLVENGSIGDVVVAARWMLDSLAEQGKIRPGTIVDIAHSSVGVVVRAGMQTPDISTGVELTRRSLSARTLKQNDNCNARRQFVRNPHPTMGHRERA
jgi:molybdate transport system substrate-binding protein